MKVVFAGTPAFSLSSLEALVRHPGAEVVGVYTQPDRPAGRGKVLTASPVKLRAEEFGIPVYQPLSLSVPEAIECLRSLEPELIVVTAYGLLLPLEVLEIPRLGCVNVHASLLPRWRGAAPIQRAIQAGDAVTGVTLMQMEAGLDTGPVLAAVDVEIDADDTAGTLHDKLSYTGGRLLSASLDDIADGQLVATPQDDKLACYAKKLDKSEAVIDWRLSATEIDRMIRAFQPWPVAETLLGEDRLRVHGAALPEPSPDIVADGGVIPGTIVQVSGTGVDVVCGDGILRLTRLQKPGGKPMEISAFLNGSNFREGMRLG